MKITKKLGALLLTAIIIFGIGAPAMAEAVSALAAESPTFYDFESAPNQSLPFEFEDVIKPSGKTWQGLVSASAPASISSSYELADDVVKINSATSVAANNVINGIETASMVMNGIQGQLMPAERIISEGGYVQSSVLKSLLGDDVKNGTVVVDEDSGVAFKVAGPASYSPAVFAGDQTLYDMAESLSGNYYVEQPQIHEVLKDFTLGGENGETVTLTHGNITGFASNALQNSAIAMTGIPMLGLADIYESGPMQATPLSAAMPIASGPPSIKFADSNYNGKKGEQLEIPYTLSGAGPITVTISAKNASGGNVSTSFSLNESAKKITASANLPAGMYSVTATATSAQGTDSATFTLSLAVGTFENIDPWLYFVFDETPLDGYDAEGSGITLHVSGGVGIEAPQLTARYSAFSGYEFSIEAAQECYLDITLQAAINEEIYIPLFGLDINFGVGHINGGVFLVLGIDGNFRLDISASEHTRHKLGVRGGTFMMVPTSVHPIFENKVVTKGDVNLSGKINAYIKLGPEMKIRIFGIDLAGAGVYLGAGVSVEITDNGQNLDVELYGLLEVYVTIIGKRINLIKFYPTIMHKKRTNMEGYKLEFDECFVSPGRVGGRFLQEAGDAKYKVPDQQIEYRVCVRKAGSNPLNAPQRYPSDGTWAKTNAGGEFFQGDGLGNDHGYNFGSFGNNVDGSINGIKGLSANDVVYLEFRLPSSPSVTRTSETINPISPFKDIVMDEADLFNNYVTGFVTQQQLRNWQTDWRLGAEDRLSVAYPPIGTAVYITPKIESIGQSYWNGNGVGGWGWHFSSQTGNGAYSFTAAAVTDETGRFDTRLDPANKSWNIGAHTLIDIDSGYSSASGNYDHNTAFENYSVDTYFDVTLKFSDAVNTLKYYYEPEMPELYFNREVYPVDGSYVRTEENGKIIDRMDYDEYIWVVNGAGERAVTDEEFFYNYVSYSKADALSSMAAGVLSNWENANGIGKKLVRTQNADGTTTTMFSQRVTVEWVWQKHPNPVKITSWPINERLTTAGGTLQVTAEGLLPAYYIEGSAPAGVTIDKDTGLITAQPGMEPGAYTLTVSAVQEYRGTMVEYTYNNASNHTVTDLIPDYEYYGHDPMPADTRTITMVIDKEPPMILPDDHNFSFETNEGESLTVPMHASGTQPITWSMVYNADDYETPEDSLFAYTPPSERPDFISIDLNTGILTVTDTAPAGTYTYAIWASNTETVYNGIGQPYSVGDKDVKEIMLTVKGTEDEQEPPTIEFENDKYEIKQGDPFQTTYALTGVEPITVTATVAGARGSSITGFTVNATTKTISAPRTLAVGTYTITATAKNDVGETTASFTLEVADAATAPVLTFSNTKYTIQQGAAFNAPFTLTGTSPITISLMAANSRGASVSGFTVDTTSLKVNAPAGIAAGTYTVTVTAKNTVGQDVKYFTLEVTSTATAPTISFGNTQYTTQQGATFSVPYTLTGTEPISMAITATNVHGASIQGFMVNAETKTVSAASDIAANTYTVTVTAKNEAGQASATFTLTVEAKQDPPVIQPGRHNFSFEATVNDRTISESLTATGSTPITWSLKASPKMRMPNFVSISSSGLLAIGQAQAGTYYFVVRAENTAGADEKEFTLTVNEPRVAPTITTVIKPDAPETKMTQGTGYKLLFAATGSDPILWSLEKTGTGDNAAPVPKEAEIDAKTGMLMIDGSIATGQHKFTVKASNDVGSDTFDFTITVQAQSRPTQPDRQDPTDQPNQPDRPNNPDQPNDPGNANDPTKGNGNDPTQPNGPDQPNNPNNPDNPDNPNNNNRPDNGGQFGSAPIQAVALSATMTMAPNVGENMPVPTQTTPDLRNTLKQQDSSSDNSRPTITENNNTGRSFADRATSHLEKAVAEDYWAGALNKARLNKDLIDKLRNDAPPPLNSAYIRHDDPKDVYTNDRFTVNGAEYVGWISLVKIDVAETEMNEMEQYNYLPFVFENHPDYYGGEKTMTGAVLGAATHYADLYHHIGWSDVFGTGLPSGTQHSMGKPDVSSFWSAGEMAGLKQSLMPDTGRSKIDGWDYLGLDEFMDNNNGRGGTFGGFNDPRAGLSGPGQKRGAERIQTLEYGQQLKEIAGMGNGQYKVGLDEDTGSYVPSDYFAGLAGKKGMSLIFGQDGADITFANDELAEQETWQPIYDFGYAPSSAFEQKMIEKAGAADAESFTYSFAHHGSLPGMATFDITTGIAEGTIVNVYKYDQHTDSFIGIANGIKVGAGGVVSYKNNTMSDYLITTAIIDGVTYLTAATTPETINLLPFVSVLAAAILFAAGTIIIMKTKKNKTKRATALTEEKGYDYE